MSGVSLLLSCEVSQLPFTPWCLFVRVDHPPLVLSFVLWTPDFENNRRSHYGFVQRIFLSSNHPNLVRPYSRNLSTTLRSLILVRS